MTPTADLLDWALDEKLAHAEEHAAAHQRLANGDMWERMFTARIKNVRRTNPTALRYDAILDAGMARLDAVWEQGA